MAGRLDFFRKAGDLVLSGCQPQNLHSIDGADRAIDIFLIRTTSKLLLTSLIIVIYSQRDFFWGSSTDVVSIIISRNRTICLK